MSISRLSLPLFALAVTAACTTANAETREVANVPAADQVSAPDTDVPQLVVAISVDQLSADLFEQYRPYFTGGLARLQQGVVFQNGYQAQAATETCPGHSTILTGKYPANNGIIANGWADFTVARENKEIYCAEDATQVPADEAGEYMPSAINLNADVLGDLLKAAHPGSMNVAVAGKDRSALMMGGADADVIFWWSGDKFGPAADGPEGQVLTEVNGEVANAMVSPMDIAAFPVPEWCEARTSPVVQGERAIGDNRFAMEAGDARAFRASPRLDEATLTLAAGLVQELGLGSDDVPDVLSVSLAATDYVGHAFGTNGVEQCIQLAMVDTLLGEFFLELDMSGIDYLAMLTADHGGLDLPERQSLQGVPEARRVDEALAPDNLGPVLAEELGLEGPVLLGEGASGDIYVAPNLTGEDRVRALAAAKSAYEAHPDVAMALTSDEIMAVDIPTAKDPREWTVVERLRASHFPPRSGDLMVALKPGVTPIPRPFYYYVATHGSPWDYDRRVPILFWRKGMQQFEQALPAITVDIAPTLASVLNLPVEPGQFDGRCLDLDGSSANSCDE